MERRYACEVGDLTPGTSMVVQGDPAVALYFTEAEDLFATDDTCTHEDWSLGGDGDLEGDEVTCPLHMARFDLRTGKPLCFPATVALRTHEVEIADNKIYVLVGE